MPGAEAGRCEDEPLERRDFLLKDIAVKKKDKTGLAHYKSLSEPELDALWKNRAAHGIAGPEEALLRTVLRDRKGFKPVETFVSICQRCNLPADNCACHR